MDVFNAFFFVLEMCEEQESNCVAHSSPGLALQLCLDVTQVQTEACEPTSSFIFPLAYLTYKGLTISHGVMCLLGKYQELQYCVEKEVGGHTEVAS